MALALLGCLAYSEDDPLRPQDYEEDEYVDYYCRALPYLEHEANGDREDGEKRGEGGNEDDHSDFVDNSWNPRKCAAAALNVLAVRFGFDLVSVLVKMKLRSDNWLERESGILALGAVAKGQFALLPVSRAHLLIAGVSSQGALTPGSILICRL